MEVVRGPPLKSLYEREILRRGFARSVLAGFEFHALTFVKSREPSRLHGGDMDEYVPATPIRLNKAVALLRIEPFYNSNRHNNALLE